jgi:signal transduction histidine kinase
VTVPSPDELLDTLSRAAVGDTDARVDTDADDLDDPLSLIGNAVNLLLDDLTYRQREREEALRTAAAAEAKEEFLAYVSHDMQTPLAILMGYLELLEDEPTEETLDGSLPHMRRATRALQRLVNQFLDYARLEAHRPLVVDPEPVDLVRLAEDVAAMFAGEGSVIVSVEDDPPAAFADEERVERILANLVANGLKHSGADDGVRVEIGSDGAEVHVAVIDRGRGLTSDDLERAFDKFQRGPTARGTPGSGLGLFVSRRLAELLGGALTAESVPGEGSRFTLTLPAHRLEVTP